MLYRTDKNILKTPDFTWRRAVVHIIAATSVLWALYFLPSGEYLEQYVRRPIDFGVRDLLGKGPVLDPRIKLLAVDDSTVAYLKNSQLSMEHWAKLVKAVESKQPRRVIIDKIFGFEDHAGGASSYGRWEKLFRTRGKNLVGGAFVAPRELRHRTILEMNDPAFQLASYVNLKPLPQNIYQYYSQLNLPRAKSPFVYGPYPGVRDAFRFIGHIEYTTNKVTPFMRVSKDVVLPHISILTAVKSEFIKDQLYVDGKVVPMLPSGEVLVNLMPFKSLMGATKSLLATLRDAEKGRPAAIVQKNDVVVVMPLMYTGNTDFNNTALGQMPASFIHVAMINSVLTGDWLTPVNAAPILILLGAIIGALFAVKFETLGTWVSFTLALMISFVVVQYLFSFYGFSIPWLFPSLSMFLACLSLSVRKNWITEGKATILRNALDGAVSPRELQNLVRNPRQVNLEAREQVITVMFIDVVGYSLLAENQIPRLAFDQLKSLLNKLSGEIHKHGGIVNKTLGDGLLCLFGYNFETDLVSTDHAERAVACAISIQEKNLKQNLLAAKRSEPVYPLRIGIHTASVFLGDLGSGDRIDFTAVGNGVNYAKRMEQACEMHSVLFSSTTKDLVASLGLASEGLKKRMISIKHHTNLIEAFEYDPFYKYPDARSRALEAYRQCASLARMEQRYTVNHPELLLIKCSVGEGVLINYSVTGISIKLKSMLVRGSTMLLSIDSVDGRLGRQLRELGVDNLMGEVRWVYSESDGHVHGILFRDVPDAQALKFVDALKYFDFVARASRTQQQIA